MLLQKAQAILKFELKEKQLYKIIQLFNTNIKNITYENQEKIKKTLNYYNTKEKLQKKHKPKNVIKL